ncbi:PRC and DUF2382 domain-containing protein [Corynebacterium phoceense]|uniref:PRC and DUF2382 domain-containing protein n=1 Tax=Corynebacterium phoceense TaxID=1686286 RepID=UPI00211BE001|nr:PRC and DUF2382 domain-containing protein [Corynebacterium phoceense]MCQ9333650.1 PRC and DUF2382 domain-containing protein [Corynebacterium phoceense]
MTTQNNTRDIQALFNATAFDSQGEKLGDVKEIFVDDASGQPTFVEVNHGLFGMNSSLVPLRGHRFNGSNADELVLAFPKDRIKDAPGIDSDAGLSVEEQNEIYRHYGITDAKDEVRYTTNDNRTAQGGRTGNEEHYAAGAGVGAAGAGVGATTGRHHADVDAPDHKDRVAGEATDRNPAAADATDKDALVRSEEQLNVEKENVKTGKARLRKYVVNETETVEVPVTREEVRVERTPISEEEAARLGNSEISEGDASVTLHEERVTVNKETVPVEKVELNKEQVRGTERVSEELQKERIETEGVTEHDPNRGTTK